MRKRYIIMKHIIYYYVSKYLLRVFKVQRFSAGGATLFFRRHGASESETVQKNRKFGKSRNCNIFATFFMKQKAIDKLVKSI